MLASTALGAAIGLALALPIENVDARCPPQHEGQVQCIMTKAWFPMITTVGIAIVVCVLLTHLIFVTIPRWQRGERRRTKGPWSDAKDPALAAASWNLTYDDAHPPRRWRPVGAKIRGRS